MLGGFDRHKQDEIDRQKRLRLEQVRQQSKAFANATRKKYSAEKEQQLRRVEAAKRRELEIWNNQQARKVRFAFERNLLEIGDGHIAAAKEVQLRKKLDERKARYEILANTRGKIAMKKERSGHGLMIFPKIGKQQKNAAIQVDTIATDENNMNTMKMRKQPAHVYASVSVIKEVDNESEYSDEEESSHINCNSFREKIKSKSKSLDTIVTKKQANDDSSTKERIMHVENLADISSDLIRNDDLLEKSNSIDLSESNIEYLNLNTTPQIEILSKSVPFDPNLTSIMESLNETKKRPYNPEDFSDKSTNRRKPVQMDNTKSLPFTQVSDHISKRRLARKNSVNSYELVETLKKISSKKYPSFPKEVKSKEKPLAPTKPTTTRKSIHSMPSKMLFKHDAKQSPNIRLNDQLANEQEIIKPFELQQSKSPSKVKMYDHSNRFYREYDAPTEIIQKIADKSAECNAIEAARDELVKDAIRLQRTNEMRRNADIRSKQSWHKEKIRREYDALNEELEDFIQQRQQEKKVTDNIMSETLYKNPQSYNKEMKMCQCHRNCECTDLCYKPIIITTPCIERSGETIVDSSTNSIMLDYINNTEQKTHNSNNNNSKKAQIYKLLNEIDEQKECLMKEINKTSNIVPSSDLGNVIASLQRIEKEWHSIVNADDEENEKLKEREELLNRKEEALEKIIAKLKKKLSEKKSSPGSSLGSPSTNYRSPPPVVKTNLSTAVAVAVGTTSQKNAMIDEGDKIYIKNYVDRLTTMSRPCVAQLNVSSPSDVDTPGQSIIDVEENSPHRPDRSEASAAKRIISTLPGISTLPRQIDLTLSNEISNKISAQLPQQTQSNIPHTEIVHSKNSIDALIVQPFISEMNNFHQPKATSTEIYEQICLKTIIEKQKQNVSINPITRDFLDSDVSGLIKAQKDRINDIPIPINVPVAIGGKFKVYDWLEVNPTNENHHLGSDLTESNLCFTKKYLNLNCAKRSDKASIFHQLPLQELTTENDFNNDDNESEFITSSYIDPHLLYKKSKNMRIGIVDKKKIDEERSIDSNQFVTLSNANEQI